MNNDLVLYAYKKGKWVRRRTLKEPLVSELYDTARDLNERHSMYHWAFPKNIAPQFYPELLKMEEIAQKHIQSYHNDFYLIDCVLYFGRKRKALWFLRDTGTNFIGLDEPLKEEDREVYEYYINHNDYFYLLDEGKIKKISKELVKLILKTKMEVAA
jgi:hypothetical protein